MTLISGNRQILEQTLSVPGGPLGPKYMDFAYNEWFREMCMMGPFNCLGGNTRIYDAERDEHIPISELYERGVAPAVLTAEGVVQRAGVPFIKGYAPIYLVELDDGSRFEATLGHAVLTSGGYRKLSDAIDAALPIGVPRSSRTVRGFPGDCRRGRRFYDAQLRSSLGSDRFPSPSRGDVLTRIRDGLRSGVLAGRAGCSHLRLASGPLSSYGASPQAVPPASSVAQFPLGSCTSEALLGSSMGAQGLPISHERTIPSPLGGRSLGGGLGGSLAHSWAHRTIKHMTLLRVDWYYDLEVPTYHNYLAEGIFHHNTGKSTALIDYLLMSGVEYPGAHLLFARAKLSDLRRTSLTKYLSRAGLLLDQDASNKNEGVYAFPEMNGKRSLLYVLGLDRVDLSEVLKSFEPFRAGLEEADEIPQKAFNLIMGRLRQKVRHRTRDNKWFIGYMAARWGCSFDRAQDLLEIPNSELDLGHFGPNQLKYVFNPLGNDPTWKRVMNVPYPDKESGDVRQWLENNVGISEFYLPYKKLPRSYEYEAGDLVGLPDGSRAYTASEKKGKPIELVDGRTFDKQDLTFIGQRASVYVWADENWSRNKAADKNFLYMTDEEMRDQYFEGIVDTRQGLVFPEFQRELHVVPAPRRDIPKDATVVVSVDQGFRHPTVALVAVRTNYPAGGLLIVKEYIVSGRSAYDNALQIKNLIPDYITNLSYWGDPSMWRTEATSMRSVADEYYDAGVLLYKADNHIEYTIETGKRMLTPVKDPRNDEVMPRIFVSEECKQLIYALETTETKHMTSSRDNWIVDMIDAFRYLLSGVYNQVAPQGLDFQKRAKPRTFDW